MDADFTFAGVTASGSSTEQPHPISVSPTWCQVPQVQSAPHVQFAHVHFGLPQLEAVAAVVPHEQSGPQVQLSPHVQFALPHPDLVVASDMVDLET